MNSLALHLVLVAAAVGSPGCRTLERCEEDLDCEPGQEECTRTGECVPQGSALRVQVRWSVNGVSPSPSRPEPCAPIGELEIVFRDSAGGFENYRPVPCELGQALYDKMPPRFETVQVIAYGETDRVVDSASQALAAQGETDVLLDLMP